MHGQTVDSGLLEPTHKGKTGMVMKNIVSENAGFGQRFAVQKIETNFSHTPAPQAKVKLSRFPPIDRVLMDIVQNEQFQDA